MLVGCAQIACTPGDIRANIGKVLDFTTMAAAKGCEVVIFPEMADTGYDMSLLKNTASKWDLEDCETPVAILAAAAADTQTTILCGLSERVGRTIYNSTAVFDPEQGLIASYRKSHLAAYPLFNEQNFITPGDTLTSVEIGSMSWGLEICYDLRFPESSRTLALKGADVLAFGSAWPFPRLEHWTTLTRARAIENQSYVIAANRVGCDGGPTFCGASAIIDPYGVTVSRASADREELIVGEIDHDVIKATRDGIPVFDHRRPEMYEESAQK